MTVVNHGFFPGCLFFEFILCCFGLAYNVAFNRGWLCTNTGSVREMICWILRAWRSAIYLPYTYHVRAKLLEGHMVSERLIHDSYILLLTSWAQRYDRRERASVAVERAFLARL